MPKEHFGHQNHSSDKALDTLVSEIFRDNFIAALIKHIVLKINMPRGKKKGLSTKKFDRCVTKVKRKGGGKNPYAICNASMGSKSKSKTKK